MDSSTDIVELVRYAYAIAYKLDLQDFVNWCNAELEGYSAHSNVSLSEYRCIKGVIMVSSYNGGEEPYYFPDTSKNSRLSRMGFPSDILTLIKLIQNSDGFINVKLPRSIEQSILEDPVYIFASQAYLQIPTSEFEIIFVMIRKIILDWTLKCER